jgi:hypothetical protein
MAPHKRSLKDCSAVEGFSTEDSATHSPASNFLTQVEVGIIGRATEVTSSMELLKQHEYSNAYDNGLVLV